MNNTENILISVIIPFYNNPVFLVRDAIESVINQKFEKYEIIVVDDGSKQAIRDELRSLLTKYKKVILVETENYGVSAARNKGVSIAKGEYVAFLDSDDILIPCFFEHAYDVAVEKDADIVIGGVKQISSRSEVDSNINYNTCFDIIEFNENDIEELKCRIIDCKVPIQFEDGSYLSRGSVSRLVKKSVAQKNIFDTSLKHGEDMLWNLMLLSDCKKIYVATEKWYLYWQNEQSATHKFNPEIYQIWYNLLTKIEEVIDLEKKSFYDAFVNRTYDGIYQIWKLYLGNKLGDKNKKRIIKKKIMTEKPWIILKECRIKKNASKKIRLFSVLYKHNCLFGFLRFRQLIGR